MNREIRLKILNYREEIVVKKINKKVHRYRITAHKKL